MVSRLDHCVSCRLRQGVTLRADVGELTFATVHGRVLDIAAEDTAAENALRLLAGPGAACGELVATAALGGQQSTEKLALHLEHLQRLGLLEYSWHQRGLERAIVTDIGAEFHFYQDRLPASAVIALSRFAYLRRDSAEGVLESPEAHCRIQFRCLETFRNVATLSVPTRLDALFSCKRETAELALLLWQTGFLERVDVIESGPRMHWEFHDLLFHWRTREGRAATNQGGTFRFVGQLESPLAVKSPMSQSRFPLPVPPIPVPDGLRLDDAIEKRRSRRDQGTEPIQLKQVARLLYHTARVTQRLNGDYQELLMRPVPAAGAIHELEFYVLAGNCEGLPYGLYHYHPEQHALFAICSARDRLDPLLRDAALAWAKPEEPPQVLVILSSRFTRLAWKYEGIAYRLSLINAGTIIQTLYLLATEMNLACAALGGGNSHLFASAAGLDPFEETSIAEFAVGSVAE